ncbi:12842_t:CDS:2 [Acaulospora colombiana]|uniref:12842_t:CDS:1 n=1 Tax=Acaulospora colombiana TaxID=27376 RepID=A0ACA9P8A1_9GLOM|nr:12842_t:CDS:2 [Acaulospora colombiana]
MLNEDLKDTSSPKKRKNEEPHEENGLPSKLTIPPKQGVAARQTEKPGKRARVSYSCSECHRRKQKHASLSLTSLSHVQCVARKVPELCKGYTPGKSENDLHLRIARLERIIEQALPQFSLDSLSDHGSPPNFADGRSRGSSPDDPATKGGQLQSGGAYFGNSAVGSVSSMQILEQLQPSAFPPTLDEPSPSDNLKSLVQECGVAPHKLPELVQELPPKALSCATTGAVSSQLLHPHWFISAQQFYSTQILINCRGSSERFTGARASTSIVLASSPLIDASRSVGVSWGPLSAQPKH